MTADSKLSSMASHRSSGQDGLPDFCRNQLCTVLHVTVASQRDPARKRVADRHCKLGLLRNSGELLLEPDFEPVEQWSCASEPHACAFFRQP